MSELTGQVALVTGAGRGFGRAIALRLAEEGAAVTVTARTRAQLDETATLIAAAGGRAHAVAADVTDRAQVERVVTETRERFGGLSLLVNNAGVPDPFGPIWTVDPDAWWNAQAVHIRAPVLFMRASLAAMVAAKAGRVIIVSAAAPRIPPLLVAQLAEGGRLVVPVGGPDEQQLARVRRAGESYETTFDTRCRYVNLLGRYGFGRTPPLA